MLRTVPEAHSDERLTRPPEEPNA